MAITIETKTIIDELNQVKSKNGFNILVPKEVVEFARDENTELHSKFEWDDSIAGEQYRIYQARNLIRTVIIKDSGIDKSIHAFVSLSPDRENEGGGYRGIYDVLENTNWRKQMLQDAMNELKSFEEKYKLLSELSLVFDAIHRVMVK